MLHKWKFFPEEAVLNVVDSICSGLDEGYNGVAGVFFDLSKAFNKEACVTDFLLNLLRFKEII